MFRKGSLNLSINAIVVLILAVTMLGLGLMFMQNMMGGAIDQLGGVSEEVEDDMIQRMTAGAEDIEFRTSNVRTRPGGGETDYFALRNNRDTDLDFNIEFHCNQAMDTEASETDIMFNFMPSLFLEQSDVEVLPFEVSANADAVLTTYGCAIFVDLAEHSEAGLEDDVGEKDDNEGEERFGTLIEENLYGYRRFNVIVER